MNKVPRERKIYDNYDLNDYFEDAKEWLIEEGNEDPSDSEIWAEVNFQDECNWSDAKYELTKFFKDKTVGFFGEVGLWHGTYKAGKIGEFWKLYYDATKDCDYVKIVDLNGKMFLKCSHHDGTNFFEIREITQKGEDYLENWECNGNDLRKEKYIHDQIYKRYSRNPNYMHKVFGCKARDYEPQTKETIRRQLNNCASSNYAGY